MKKNFNSQDVYDIISMILSIIGTAFLPNILTSIFPLNIKQNYLALLICSFLLVIFFLLKKLLLPNTQFFDSSEFITKYSADYNNHIKDIKNIHNLRIYSISSAYWNDEIEKRENVKIDNCIIMIRNTDKLTSDGFADEVQKSIDKWKSFVEKGRIKHLKIIQYDNIPDINYIIIDDIALITGLNLFNKNDSTMQRGDRNPLHIYGDNKIKKGFIKKYINHFDNYHRYYYKNTIYDSYADKSLKFDY